MGKVGDNGLDAAAVGAFLRRDRKPLGNRSSSPTTGTGPIDQQGFAVDAADELAQQIRLFDRQKGETTAASRPALRSRSRNSLAGRSSRGSPLSLRERVRVRAARVADFDLQALTPAPSAAIRDGSDGMAAQPAGL